MILEKISPKKEVTKCTFCVDPGEPLVVTPGMSYCRKCYRRIEIPKGIGG
jgi:hypothetical protein